MRLPEIEIHLPDWREHDFDLVQNAIERLQRISKVAGSTSDKFEEACRRILTVVLKGDPLSVGQQLKTSIDVRALTYLLSNSEPFIEQISVTPSLLADLLKPRSPLSKLSLMQLIRAYFTCFDQLASQQELMHWQQFIVEQLGYLGSKSSDNDFSAYYGFSSILFAEDGPARVVSFAKNKKLDFDGALERLGLTGFTGGRFLTLAQYQYYLDTLKSIPVGSEDSILNEIIKPDVVNAPFDRSRLLGHAILEVLIDRSEAFGISPAWQSTILEIAGDPRVPKSNESYQKWWALLGEHRIALMRGWLSRFDLTLFLQVLEQSAKDSGNADMERMFESRKVFMEGLLDSGTVIQSRLFLSRYAEHYLKRQYRKEELPEYARVSSPDTSMIYLNLKGKAHMIEGSHSFRLKLVDALPSSLSLLDYGVKFYDDSKFRTDFETKYIREYQNPGGIRSLTHDQHLNWQKKAIDYMVKHGVEVLASELISPSRYREYKSKFGVY